MMQEQDLHELAELVSEGGSVLSLYLHIDPQRRSADETKLSLRRLLAQAAAQGASPADVERIERFFEHEYDRQGLALALFSCQACRFWRGYTLLVPVRSTCYVGSRPYITPLSDLWDNYGRVGVILVDRGARASSSITSVRWRIRSAPWGRKSSTINRAAGRRRNFSATRIRRPGTT